MNKGEPVLIVGGLFTPVIAYRSWQKRLEAAPYNQKTYITEIGLQEWAGTLVENFGPALQAISRASRQALTESRATRLKLVGHSAGGRLARLWLAERSYNGTLCGGKDLTSTIIMLGAANQTKEPWSIKSVAWANQQMPGAFYPEIEYVTVIGKKYFGRLGLNPVQNLAAVNYRVQSGQAAQWGDGVIPVAAAALPGTTNLVLENIFHGEYSKPSALAQWGKFL